MVVVKPMPGWALAAGVIGAVDSVTRGLAVDLAPIRVNMICPGYVVTEVSYVANGHC
jgi:NAD(P)-dependent dehydrogenase (short-subunit alcohol dehydrogenase family)